EGGVAPVAAVAVVVGAAVADRAVGGQPGLVAVLDEAGVGGAVRAGDAGALVAPFLPAWRPAWWQEAASRWERSRRSYSTWPNALSSGRSTSFSAIRRSACSASGLSRSTSAWTRASRSEVSGAAGGGCLFNMLTFLALRPIGASDFSLLLPDYDYPQIFPPIFLPHTR